MKNTFVLTTIALLFALTCADILSPGTFKNPFSQSNVKFAPTSQEVTSSLPFKEAQGSDRELVEQLMPYVLTIRDLEAERANFENSSPQKHGFDDEEFQLAS